METYGPFLCGDQFVESTGARHMDIGNLEKASHSSTPDLLRVRWNRLERNQHEVVEAYTDTDNLKDLYGALKSKQVSISILCI